MIHNLFQSSLTNEDLKIKFSIVCLSNNEKNVTSTWKCLRRMDTKDGSVLFRIIKEV